MLLFALFKVAVRFLVLQERDARIFSPMPEKYASIELAMSSAATSSSSLSFLIVVISDVIRGGAL